MTQHRPHTASRQHDYIPAFGKDALLPFYDLLTMTLRMGRNYDALVAQADVVDGLRVLEIGCGTGSVTTRIKRAAPGADVVGTDPDPLALARSQRKARRLSGIRFERAYAQQLPFADGEFDRVLSSMMLHHLDDDTKAAAAAESFRVLRAGGSVHVLDVGGAMTAGDGFAARRMLRSQHLAGSLGDAIPRLLRSVGFDASVVASRPHPFVGRLTFYRGVRPIQGT
ncbi:class I SAM-dependent methyltransferase [Mycobacterium sp. NPDC048908]|uniref:class I SAM-dependent methyltransferase n=1 Tax=Mycobacterium sp. NPDC048908 TaxID=3364292 RepID=UPI00371951A4